MSDSAVFDLEAVFIHTANMKPVIRLYSDLLGISVVPGLYDSSIYAMELNGGVKLLIDDHRLDLHHYDPQPAFALRCSDLEKARHAAIRGKWDVTSPILQGNGLRFFMLRDPEDGHSFIVIDSTIPYPAADGTACGITRIYLPVRQTAASLTKYASLLGMPPQPQLHAEPLPEEAQAEQGACLTLPSGIRLMLVPNWSRESWPLARVTMQSSDLSDTVRSRLRSYPDSRHTIQADGSIDVRDTEGNRLVIAGEP